MSNETLAFMAPLVCSLVCFGVAHACVWSYVLNIRPWFVMIAAAGFLMWSLYWSLLAISAGPNPTIPRGEMTKIIRWAEFSGGLFVGAWALLWTRSMVRMPHRWRRTWRNGVMLRLG